MGNLISQIFVDPTALPHTPGGFIVLLFHLFIYGYILSKSSSMISDGSELLLLIPSLAGIVGSVVLPILGAVPDGAIVIFSGLGPDAQEQLSVGVGALAGSTIMLLTIPWFLCIIKGRVDIRDGEAQYKSKVKLSPQNRWKLNGCGITPNKSVGVNGKIMIATAISYLFIQMPAFGAGCGPKDDPECRAANEHKWAIVSFVLCIVAFTGYLVYNVKFADEEEKEDVVNQVRQQAIEMNLISLSTAFEGILSDSNINSTPATKEERENFEECLKKFFKKYDLNGDKKIDRYELRMLFKDFNEKISNDEFEDVLRRMDSDNSGAIDFKEFSAAMTEYLGRKTSGSKSELKLETIEDDKDIEGTIKLDVVREESIQAGEEEDDEEEEEVPEDLASLPPNQQRMRILWRSCWMMGLGTLIVLLFSDPMVDVLSELGNRIRVPPFYVAFVLAPIASNASELIASIAYASKKTQKTITISIGALEGAACMNNTFCLALFLILIIAKGLVWEFSAETLSILFVELAVFGFTFKRTHTIRDGILIILLYPLSLLLVGLLEGPGGLN